MKTENQYKQIATDYGFKNITDGRDETTNEKYILNLREGHIFMRDSPMNYHGYSFKFKSPNQLRSLLELIQHDI